MYPPISKKIKSNFKSSEASKCIFRDYKWSPSSPKSPDFGSSPLQKMQDFLINPAFYSYNKSHSPQNIFVTVRMFTKSQKSKTYRFTNKEFLQALYP